MEASKGQEDLFFSDLLQQFRRRKKLTQKQVAERIEVSRDSVSLWERGEYKPEADRILYKLVDVLDLTAQEQQQLFEAYTVTALATSFHNPPFKRNPYFTGRSSQLNQLHTLLMAGTRGALTQAISGLGGIGKTQLALEYAYRYQKSFHDIFWASAETEESLMASYVLFAGLLRLPEYKEPDQNKVKEAVQHWFKKHTSWLLILDNMEDLNLLQHFLPVDRQGAVLLTTRQQVTEPVAQTLALELLPENDALLFLCKRTKVLAVDRSLEDASDHDMKAARAITHLLGNLPLALDQAGAYILETPCSFAEYLVLFQMYQDRLLQRRIGERIATDHPESVTATFRMNFQQVQHRSNAAGELLRLCAFLASDAIPEEILTGGASLLGPVLSPVAANAFQLNQAIEALHAYSLIKRDPKEKSLSIHRLVQAVLQDTLEETERRTWAERAMLAVNAAFPEVEYKTWPQCERLLPHALLCGVAEHTPLATSAAAHLFNQVGDYLKDRVRYVEAEPLLQRALAIREQLLGTTHPDTASSLNKLAILYHDQGKYREAEPLYWRALAIREQQLGAVHPDTASSLNNLATLYYRQGRYVEAEPLFQRGLTIREQQLEATHPHTAQSLNNLALLYYTQRRYEDAESLFQRALVIDENAFGPEHPDIAVDLNNLAVLYYDQGKYEEAEPLHQRALAIREQQLESTHPDIGQSLNNLGELRRAQGKYGEAEPMYQRALAIWEQQLGPDHPLVADSLNGMANLYTEQTKYAEAEPLYQRALSIRRQRLGTEHPETAEVLHDFASFQEAQGNYQEALSLYQRVLVIREHALGQEHPKTRDTRQQLTILSQTLKRDSTAPLLERAQDERRE